MKISWLSRSSEVSYEGCDMARGVRTALLLLLVDDASEPKSLLNHII